MAGERREEEVPGGEGAVGDEPSGPVVVLPAGGVVGVAVLLGEAGRQYLAQEPHDSPGEAEPRDAPGEAECRNSPGEAHEERAEDSS